MTEKKTRSRKLTKFVPRRYSKKRIDELNKEAEENLKKERIQSFTMIFIHALLSGIGTAEEMNLDILLKTSRNFAKVAIKFCDEEWEKENSIQPKKKSKGPIR